MRSPPIVFPLPACGDYLPLLAVQDGRLGEMVAQCENQDTQIDSLAFLIGYLYPNCCWSDRPPREPARPC